MNVTVGTAAWNLPKESHVHFPTEGTHLQRYAGRLSGVEINSSFYREHKASTYKKWADSVPDDFKFSVKLAKTFTHLQKLEVDPEEVKTVLQGIRELGAKWEVLLVQLPPSLAFEENTARRFFSVLRDEFQNQIAFEPRHKTWVEPAALKVFEDFALCKVLADPEPCPLTNDTELNYKHGSYFRLHGSPEIYKSNYASQDLREYFSRLAKNTPADKPAWCIFDNTTFGYATLNALEMNGFNIDALAPDLAAEKPPQAFKKRASVLYSPNA